MITIAALQPNTQQEQNQGRFISKVLTIEELRKSQLQNRKREKISVFLRAIVSAISSLLKGRNISKETKDLIKQVRIFF